MKKIHQFSVLISILFAVQISFGQTNDSATIDMADEYQHISGFGGANIPDWIGDLNADQVDKAFGNAPGQIGLGILRLKVPNSETGFDALVPTAVRAASLGTIIIASPWSPPASMKSNGSIVGGYLNPESYGAYADHLLGFTGFMKTNGAPVYAISIQNEPDIPVTYESCDWTPAQMSAFLKEQGLTFDSVRVIVSESFRFDKLQTDPILNDPEAEQYVDIIGGHIYGGGLSDYPLAREKGKEVWMTEHFTDENHSADDWPLALGVATEIHRCMEANYSAYVWWYVRRFYGLISENGNITKRGYVMSQFSKFIRPGYRRVGVPTNSAYNVDVSAYKTDSTFVIVSVNRNPTPADIDFKIENGLVDTLNIYTTSASKNVEPGGMVVAGSGLFSAILDAQSITTFTSPTGYAGKMSNVPPIANAGEDQTLYDDDNGIETAILDGSGSNDPDGSIINYSWALDEIQIAWSESTTIELSTGAHQLVLTVTDNDGAIHKDTVVITVESSYTTVDNQWFEVECGQVGTNWNIVSDADASNGLYVTSKPGNQPLSNASSDPQDHVVFTFDISEEGSFKLWGRAKVPTADDDSYWVRMDNGSWIMWNSISGGNSWQWDDVHNSNQGGDAEIYQLAPGGHTLIICHREDGAQLDKLYLTKTGGTPSGLGDDAGTCVIEGDHLLYSQKKMITLYPNPANGIITIESEGDACGENELYLYNSLGILIKVIQMEEKKHTLDVSSLPKGVYFIKMNPANGAVYVEIFLRL